VANVVFLFFKTQMVIIFLTHISQRINHLVLPCEEGVLLA